MESETLTCPFCYGDDLLRVEVREWGKHADGHTIYECPRCERLVGTPDRRHR